MALEGYLDLVTSERICGWARDDLQPNQRVTVEILLDDKPLAQCTANEYRADLKAAAIGDGAYGFSYQPNLPLDDIQMSSLSARIVGLAKFRLVGGGPRQETESTTPGHTISVPDFAIGDVITSFPALYQLASELQSEAPLRLWLQNPQLRPLWAGPPVELLSDQPRGIPGFGIHNAARLFRKSGIHIIQAWFSVFDLPIPTSIPQIELAGGRAAEQIDVIISPYSATGRKHRSDSLVWSYQNWNIVIDALIAAGLSVAVCGVFQPGADPRSFDEKFWGDRAIRVLDSPPLVELVGYLRAARCVATIDNGIGHLAHLLGVPHAQILPVLDYVQEWIANRNANARWICEDFKNSLVPERVLELIFGVLATAGRRRELPRPHAAI